MILGTAAYMAPEQAKGKSVDRRADVWAFGAVLYEMLAGKKAFAGDDISDTLVSVLRDEPDWAALVEGRSRAVLLRGTGHDHGAPGASGRRCRVGEPPGGGQRAVCGRRQRRTSLRRVARWKTLSAADGRRDCHRRQAGPA
ncbi:MAG: hypothetical protein EXQ48_03235 [Acidobacteria bacterium]|nr:hypothetical protein [Acidobacteriota bacterium]